MYNSADETLSDWAQRHLERDAEAGVLTSLREVVPQTTALGAGEAAARMRDYASRLSKAADDIEAGKSIEDARLALLTVLAEEQLASGLVSPELLELAATVDETTQPDWVEDEVTWGRAKAAIKDSWDSYDEPYAVVATIYQNMGGKTR